MAVGEKKVSLMDHITSAPDSAKLYIVLEDGSYGYILKSEFLSGVTITPYATFQFLKKGFGNSGTTPGAEGDVYQGWVSEGVYSPHAVYNGSGDLDNPASFEHKQLIEY